MTAIAITGTLIIATVMTAAVGPMPRTGAAIIALGLLSLAGRRYQPLPAAIATVVVVITIVLSAPDAVKAPVLAAVALVAYSVVRYESGGRLLSGLLVCAGGVAIARLVLPAEHAHGVTIAQLEVVLVFFPALVAALIRVRGELPRLLDPELLKSSLRDAGPPPDGTSIGGDHLVQIGRGLRQVGSWIEFGRTHRDGLFSIVAAGLVALVLMMSDVGTGAVTRDVAVFGLAVIAVGSVALVGRWPWPALLVALAAAVSFTGVASLPDAYDSVIGGLVVIGLPLLVSWMLRQGPAVIALAACTSAVIVMGVVARTTGLGAMTPAITGQEVLSSVALVVGAWSAGRVLRRGCQVAWTGARSAIAAGSGEPPEQLLPDAAELTHQADLLGLRPTTIQVALPATDEPLPRAVAEVVRQVLDEALTNAARHAPGAELMIKVAAERSAIRIDVINGPAADADQAIAGEGRGVPALAGRIAAMGGMFWVGPASGGFGLRAKLPVEEPGNGLTSMINNGICCGTGEGTGGQAGEGAGGRGDRARVANPVQDCLGDHDGSSRLDRDQRVDTGGRIGR